MKTKLALISGLFILLLAILECLCSGNCPMYAPAKFRKQHVHRSNYQLQSGYGKL